MYLQQIITKLSSFTSLNLKFQLYDAFTRSVLRAEQIEEELKGERIQRNKDKEENGKTVKKLKSTED